MKLAPDEITNVIIGTAGHVDHGKTKLVEALTGTNTDRWEEERRRGITIDIGFASRDLPDGRRAGFIDMPGHERFVRHMIAGATGVDVVLLVVAADDGVMPQTREHLDIMELVGAREGVVAVTKIDLDRELAELAAEEVRAFLKGTFLEDAPVVPVSSVTGEGLDDLWAALAERVARAGPRSSDGLFRMPVQRVFVREGFGAILTGVPVSGTARPGDAVDVLPGGGRGRIRGVQAYFRDVELARAGHSTGLNVADLDTSACRRGQVVVPADTYEPSVLVDARLHLLPAARHGGADDAARKPMATGEEVRFHTGTAEVAAKVVILDGEAIEPGGEALVQFRLEEPVVFDRLDRFVIRRPSPSLTIGGGTIIGPGRRRLRGGRPWIAERVRGRELASRSDESFVEHLIETASGGSIRADILHRAALLPAERTGEIVKSLEAARRLLSFPPGPSYAHSRTIQRLLRRLSESLAELHRREPDLPGLDVKRAAAELGVAVPLLGLVVAEGLEAGELARDGGHLRLASHTPSLGGGDAELAGKVESVFREAGYTPPGPAEVARRLGAREERVTRVSDFLAHAGALVRVAPGMFFHAEHVGSAREFIRGELGEKGAVETQAVKAFMVSAGGTSRKYLVPLLEHFDRTGLTRREGDLRKAGDGARLEPKRGK
jgi:selenocysteine-specific elongation factor